MKVLGKTLLAGFLVMLVVGGATNNDPAGVIAGLIAAFATYVYADKQQRLDNARNILLGMQAVADNTDPVQFNDSNVSDELTRAILMTPSRGLSPFGGDLIDWFWDDFERVQDDLFAKDEVALGATACVMVGGERLHFDKDFTSVQTAYYAGYHAGRCEPASNYSVPGMVLRPWQEVLWNITAGCGADRSAEVEPHILLAVAEGHFHGRTGRYSALRQPVIELVRESRARMNPDGSTVEGKVLED